ncbi:unnamed protein product [Arctogadus glacialis]
MNPATRNGSPSLRSREREVAICPVVCCLSQDQRLPPLLDSCQEDPSVRWRTSASLHPYSDERKKRQKQKSNVSKPQLEDSIRLQVYGHTAIVNAAFSRFL